MISSSPLPQSRSPPSQIASGSRVSSVTGTPCAGSIRNAGGAGAQELDQLRAADDRRALDQGLLVELALLEAGRADPDHAARLGELRHQVLQRVEALLVDRVGE